MSTSVRDKPKFQRAFVPTSALAKAITFSDDSMQVTLSDGRVIGVPLVWFPRLREATPAQRARVDISGGGVSLHWPELDEDLSVAGLLAGGDERSM